MTYNCRCFYMYFFHFHCFNTRCTPFSDFPRYSCSRLARLWRLHSHHWVRPATVHHNNDTWNLWLCDPGMASCFSGYATGDVIRFLWSKLYWCSKIYSCNRATCRHTIAALPSITKCFIYQYPESLNCSLFICQKLLGYKIQWTCRFFVFGACGFLSVLL